MRKIQITILSLISSSILLMVSCINPMDQNAINELLDKEPPIITINSPVDNGKYTQNVVVSAVASDGGGKIRQVRYEVNGTLGNLLSGTIPGGSLSENGAFSFQFSTITYDGPIVISLTGEDWNDNTATATVGLQDPGSPVSSFSAIPSNKKINLTWEAVEGAENYTIYYTDNGTVPSELYGASLNISGTSHELGNLNNGKQYIFLLKANLAGGVSYWSSYISAIPLSQMTLAPMVKQDYGEIYLEWSEIEATDEFIILRSTSLSGPFEIYTGTIRGTEYRDKGVSDNTWYYYKVMPDQEGSIKSYANGAQTFQNPPTPEEGIANLNTPGPANKVKSPPWGGNYTYVAAGSSGLLVVDISTPLQPEIAATLSTTNALDVDFYDFGSGIHYAYIADGAGKIRSIDISNPLNPILKGTYGGILGNASVVVPEPGYNRLFAIDSSGETALFSFSITSSGGITLLASFTDGTTYDYLDLAISHYSSGAFAYITTSDSDVVLEKFINNGINITYTKSYTDPEYYPRYIDVSGSYVYVIGAAKAYLEPPPPYTLSIITKYPILTPVKIGMSAASNGYITDLTVSGNNAYAADGKGLQIFDISTPASPQITDFWNTPGSSSGVTISGNYGFIASGSLGFHSVDTSLPNSLSVAGSYDPGGGYSGISLRGNRAYVIDPSTGLQILNISNPLNPLPVAGGSLALSTSGNIALSGPYAFISRGSSGLSVADISDPASPQLVGSAPSISGSVGRIIIKGDYAYLAGNTGLQVYDVSDPTAPVGVGFFDTDGGGMKDVNIRGNLAYVAQGAYFQPSNLTILNISNPRLPVLVDKKSSGMVMSCLDIWGKYAFTGNNFPGGGIYNINIDPESGSYLTAYGPCEPNSDANGVFYDVAAFGNFLYALSDQEGFLVIDISNPSSMSDSRFLRSLNWTNSSPKMLQLNGRYAFIADSTEGLIIMDLF